MGSLLAGVVVTVGVLLPAIRGGGGGGASQSGAIPSGLLALQPRAWLSAGALVLPFTPPLGLVTTASEYLRSKPRYSGVCLLVLGVLAASVAVAIRI